MGDVKYLAGWVRGDWTPEGKAYPCFFREVDGRRELWNGWQCPYFGERAVRDLGDDTEALGASIGYENTDVVQVLDEGPIVRVSILSYGDDGKGIAANEDVEPVKPPGMPLLWPVGGWAWCWYEASGPEGGELREQTHVDPPSVARLGVPDSSRVPGVRTGGGDVKMSASWYRQVGRT